MSESESNLTAVSLDDIIELARKQTEEYQELLEKSGHTRDEGTDKELVMFIDLAKGHQNSTYAKTSRLNLQHFSRHLQHFGEPHALRWCRFCHSKS